jgi:hypothetical protein
MFHKHHLIYIAGRFFHFTFEIGSCYTAQAGLKMTTLLPHSSKCWDYRCGYVCILNHIVCVICYKD